MSSVLDRGTNSAGQLVPDLTIGEVHRFTVAEYHRLGEAGILTPEDRVELIDGLLVRKAMQNTPHARAVRRLVRRLTRLGGDAWSVQSQLPVTLRRSEPEPDVCVMLGPDERYDDRHPGPRDIGLVVEVSDTSLRLDRGAKLRAYALNGLPVYWIVNIPETRVEVYTSPRGGRTPVYRSRTDHDRGGRVPVVLNGERVGEIAVNDLLA